MTFQPGDKVLATYVDALSRPMQLEGVVHSADSSGGWWIDLPLGIRVVIPENQLVPNNDAGG